MTAFLFGLMALLAFVAVARLFLRADPRRMARALRFAGVLAGLIAGVALTAAGKAIIGIPLIVLCLPFLRRRTLGEGRAGPAGARRQQTYSGGSAGGYLDLERDERTGVVSARVRAGRFAGMALDALRREELFVLAQELQANDQRALRLVEPYLDRRAPGWREHLQGNGHARRRNTAGQGAMTEQEAYQILGLDARAGPDEIRRAHRALMKKVHPDQGGSNHLASRVNQAKDLLMRTHN
jgi:hypothetical protein